MGVKGQSGRIPLRHGRLVRFGCAALVQVHSVQPAMQSVEIRVEIAGLRGMVVLMVIPMTAFFCFFLPFLRLLDLVQSGMRY